MLEERVDPPQPVVAHLIALRSCLVASLLSWAGASVACAVFSPAILSWLKTPAAALEKSGRLTLEGLDLTSGFSTILDIALWGGLALAFPFIAFFILRFVFPALTRREKASILAYLVFGTFGFAAGFALAYAKMLPVAVSFFDAVNGWVGLPVSTVRIEGYISIVLKALLGLGLVFQIPLMLFVLGCLGVVSSTALRKARRFAIVVAFFLGMVLTPPDPMSQLIMAVPLCILYELAIWGVWIRERAARQ